MSKFIVEVTKAYEVEAITEDDAFERFMSSPIETYPCDWEEVGAIYRWEDEGPRCTFSGEQLIKSDLLNGDGEEETESGVEDWADE